MVRRVVARLGPKLTALLVAGCVAVAALLPILLVTGGGSGKPTPGATAASTPETTSTSTPQARAPKHRAKAAARHHAARHRVAARRGHHQRHTTSTTPRTSTAPASATHTSSTPQPATVTSSISFDLLGRSGDTTSRVCGAPRHYHTYSTGETLGISGRVSPIPSAIWKVKVKIETCSGAAFTDFVKIEPTLNKHRGTFSGSFPAPAAGFYRARAELYVNDVRTVDSTDEHFKTH
jgi:hypothetical protein